MLLLDITIVNVALPTIAKDLKASFSDIQWVINAYALMLASLLLTTGSLADLLGRRLVFSIGLGLFAFTSLLCALAPSALFLILARGGQGIGGAIMFSTSLALLAQEFHGRERGTAFGAWGATIGISTAVGPLVHAGQRDVGRHAVPQADVRRRLAGRVHAVLVDVRDVPLPDAVPADGRWRSTAPSRAR